MSLSRVDVWCGERFTGVKLSFALPHMVRLKALTQPWEAGVTGADQTRMVKRAEALGYDMIAIPEHFGVCDMNVGDVG
jgi:hypothetical protein